MIAFTTARLLVREVIAEDLDTLLPVYTSHPNFVARMEGSEGESQQHRDEAARRNSRRDDLGAGRGPDEAQAAAVLVLGTTITATQVIVQPTGDYGSAASAAAGVIPFQQGAPSTSQQVGQIPANYSQGSGMIVSGMAANKATEAALAACPGGVVDRVVQLSNGEYEVHNIGVNWPHHIFVNQDLKVIGAD